MKINKSIESCYKVLGLGFLFLSIQMSLLHAQAGYNLPVVKQYKLPNGLTVILNEDHTKPQVFGVVVVKAGSKNDPSDATGCAHYQEHMLFKGTQELGTTNWVAEKPHIDKIFTLYDELGREKTDSIRKKIQLKINEESLAANQYVIPNELDKIVKMMGGTHLNANTSYDRTVFFNAFPSGQIEKWLELYSHRFMEPVFRSFQAELEVVYEEKNLYADMFQMNLLESFQSKFYKNHPYGRPVIGTIGDLKNPSLTKMYNFFKTYYVANNMALILSGDFNTEEVMPMIESKFGNWSKGEIPKQPDYRIESFHGRESAVVKMSPIKIGILGYQTVPNGHPDEIALEVACRILSNQNQTGLLDKLTLNNKLIAAAMIPMQMNDCGAAIILFIPKIVKQSLDIAEKLALEQIEKLKKGEFEDWMIDAIKYDLYKDYQTQLETGEWKALSFAEAFAANRDISDFLAYPDKVMKITREDILRVANKYFGKDYLSFYSKMGFPKKEKIDKPGYKPVISNMNAKSVFTERLEKIPSKEVKTPFIDFNKDISDFFLKDNARLIYNTNPKNDIFTLTIRYGVGENKLPMLKYASQMMNYSGTITKNLGSLKDEFSKIGCTYGFSSNDNYLEISLSGVEQNLSRALVLINELITQPALEQKKLKILIDGEKANRKMESSEPDNVAEALFEYVKYGDSSAYLNRLTMKEIEHLKSGQILDVFKKATTFQTLFFYCGSKDPETVKSAINQNLTIASNLASTQSPVIRNSKKYSENTVFLVNKSKAIQSKIYLFANGDPLNISKVPYMKSFNMYFGGDFSGLVLQEIREFRSLAYGAGAYCSIPKVAHENSNFIGYVGTQADKTLEALGVFDTLIRFMPEKPERIDMIKDYLIQSSLASKPDFRDLSTTIETWKNMGYTEDPLKTNIPAYQNLKFIDILNFYRANVQQKPLVIAVVGNTSRIKTTELNKYGKLIELKESSLFKK